MTVSINLIGKTALVTGASSGIGAATAIRLAEAGAHVIVHYNSDPTGAENVKSRIEANGGTANTLGLNLGLGRDAGKQLFAHAAESGKLDIAVLSAGTSKGVAGNDYTDEALDTVLGVNTLSFLGFLEAANEGTALDGGAIALVSSTAATLPLTPLLPYGLSKAGANYLVRSGALLLQEKGIRVNAVSPGATATPARKNPEQDKLIRAEGRMAEPEDIADVALFLSSDLSRWLTGQVIEAFGKHKI